MCHFTKGTVFRKNTSQKYCFNFFKCSSQSCLLVKIMLNLVQGKDRHEGMERERSNKKTRIGREREKGRKGEEGGWEKNAM